MLRLLPLPLHLPLFRLEVRRVRWLQSASSVRNQSLLIFVIVMLITISTWMVLVLPHRGLVRGFVVSDTIIRTLFFFSIGANMLLDARCLLVTRAGGHYTAVYWDLLRLATHHKSDITTALHSLAQVRTWRLTAIIISMRIAPVVLLLIHMLAIPYWFDDSYTVFDSLVDAFRVEPLLTTEIVVGFLLLWAVFMLEPLWRMRAMTAISLAVRAYFSDGMMAMLIGSAVILGLWIVQSIIFTYVALMSIWVGGLWANLIGQFLAITIGILLGIGLLFMFYRRLIKMGLRFANRALFRDRPA